LLPILEKQSPSLSRGVSAEHATCLLLELSSAPLTLSPFNFLFLGTGVCRKVHSWWWKSHKTQSFAPSLITHLLLRFRHASQGRSLRGLVSPFSVGFTAPEEGDAMVVAALQNSGRDSLDYIALRLEKFDISRRLRNVKVKARK
jgi:hypothetical protein